MEDPVRPKCDRCDGFKRIPLGEGCISAGCVHKISIPECTCDPKESKPCSYCLQQQKIVDESEAKYKQLVSRLHDCWCGAHPEIYNRCRSTGGVTEVIYSYIHCDECRHTGERVERQIYTALLGSTDRM